MFHLCMFIFATLLFFVLTPGILLSLPPKSKPNTVALVHALVFALVWSLIYKMVWNITEGFEPAVNSQLYPSDVLTSSSFRTNASNTTGQNTAITGQNTAITGQNTAITGQNTGNMLDQPFIYGTPNVTINSQRYAPETNPNIKPTRTYIQQSNMYPNATEMTNSGTPIMTNSGTPIMTNSGTPFMTNPPSNNSIQQPPNSNKISDYIEYINKYSTNKDNAKNITRDYKNIESSKTKLKNYIQTIINSKKPPPENMITAYKNLMNLL